MFNGYALVVGGGAAAFTALAVAYSRKAGRGVAILCVIAGFFLTAGIGPWLGALAGLAATKTGMAVLLIVTVAGGMVVWHEVVRKHKHHPVRTPVMSGLFGVTLLLAISNAGQLIGQAASTPGRASTALSAAVSQVQSGQAAAAVPANHRLVILGIGAVVILAVVFLLSSARGRSGGTIKGKSKGKGLPGGRRPALTSGRRR